MIKDNIEIKQAIAVPLWVALYAAIFLHYTSLHPLHSIPLHPFRQMRVKPFQIAKINLQKLLSLSILIVFLR